MVPHTGKAVEGDWPGVVHSCAIKDDDNIKEILNNISSLTFIHLMTGKNIQSLQRVNNIFIKKKQSYLIKKNKAVQKILMKIISKDFQNSREKLRPGLYRIDDHFRKNRFPILCFSLH